ncbi:pantetheine-phosphate adenylyltransferase [uncultured Clostridium sp.]|uniref:pantetheine-phosphate adenylyltransferase n=1 Tax=uncultured Clostridium sp. TaxID=59620 RepID=UPI00260B4EC6|nr:pantetheine-phosphate adenylyltransferase [uncultured Clostridium sp.]
MRKAIYPGSFDPVTKGHLDIIRRGAKNFDKLTVSVLVNIDKKGLFTIDERVELLKEATKEFDNVEIISFSGLLVDLVRGEENLVVLKGLRNSTDFNYEMQMDNLNKVLDSECETMYLVSIPKYSSISSSAVKQIARFGGDISFMVNDVTEKKILEKISMV